MWDVLESTKVDTLVLPEPLGAHIAVVFDDLAQNLRREHLFLRIDVSMLAALVESLPSHDAPIFSLDRKLRWCQK